MAFIKMLTRKITRTNTYHEKDSLNQKLLWKAMRWYFLMIVLISSTATQAGVMKDMQKFFNGFGSATNSSTGSAFKDQSANYITGGSAFIRNPVRQQRLMSVTTPGAKFGCGGINIFTGGMSFINSEGLNHMLQAIMSNAASYGMMLAIETYAPQIHSIITYLNKLAADFNRLNINSCETSALLVGGAWPKSDMGSAAVCKMIATHDGNVADYVRGRHDCANDSSRNSHLNRAPKDMLVGEFNLAWKMLDKMSFLWETSGNTLSILNPDSSQSADTSGKAQAKEGQLMKEIFMTLSGTVINRRAPNGEGYIQLTLPAKAGQENFVKALMQGGTIQVYKCDEPEKCLNPTLVTETLPIKDALLTKIEKMLDDIVVKISDDDGSQAATEGEMSLINASHLPIYKILNVTTAFQKGRAPINIHQYGELITFDVIYKYINDVLYSFTDSINQLRSLQFSDDHIQSFIEGINYSRTQLGEHRRGSVGRMDMLLGFIQKTQLIEKQIQGMMGTLGGEYGV